jgi:acetolactate synthase I/II/III large subunit
MRGSDIIVEMLIEYDVQHVFGVSGDTSIRLYESLYAAQDRITHILARDERSASYMADAYARLSNKPGVCESPSGAGALYTVPGVAEANASSVPVIALTSGVDLASEGKGTITELDHHVLYQSITKWSHFVKRYDKIPDAMRRAFRLATSGRPGAVHVAFPQEVLSSHVPDGQKDIYAEAACRSYPTYRARAERRELDRAIDHLLGARRPVFIAGGGVINAQAWGELTTLAEMVGAAVGTTITGKGAIAEDHPLAIGVVGDNGYREYANEMVRQADLLFYIGCKTGSVTTIKWTLPDPHESPTVLHLDIDATLIGNNYPTEVGLVGDAQLILADLVALVGRRLGMTHDPNSLAVPGAVSGAGAGPARATDRPDPRAEIAAGRSSWWQSVSERMASNQMPVKPHRVMAALRRVLPHDAIVVADAGTPTPYVSAYYELHRPGRHVIIPRAYGGLGYAIPAAIGAKIARPEQLVVALCGDGSFGMSAGELETLARLDLPVVLLNFNNSCFGWIKALQSIHLDGRYLGVDFSTIDHGAVARAFGMQGTSLERAEDLEDTLVAAIASGKPTLIDIPSESEEKDLPQMKLWRDSAAAQQGAGLGAGAGESRAPGRG